MTEERKMLELTKLALQLVLLNKSYNLYAGIQEHKTGQTG